MAKSYLGQEVSKNFVVIFWRIMYIYIYEYIRIFEMHLKHLLQIRR